ncbi:MAG TPA: hypothetical protein VHX44_04735 [Planctomycetota bacterium]|nr:hypothetical protein [Planctomycetota bacterium]
MRLIHLCCVLALALPCTLSAAEGEGKGHEAKKEAPDTMKTGTKGTSEGSIVSLEKGKLVLATTEGNLLFMPHWKGGMPKDGGGMDKETLTKLEGFKVGDKVKIGWSWEERRRIETIEKL